MTPVEEQSFTIPPAFVRTTWITTGFFGALTLLSAALPFIPDSDGSGGDTARYVLSAIGVLFFGGFTVMGSYTLTELRTSAVTIDDDGLWSANEPKETALVRWNSISKLENRRILQRLDVLDAHGNRLIRLEYQLSGFERLRAVILERLKHHYTRPQLPATFAKPMSFHANAIAGGAAFVLAGWYIGATDPVIGFGVGAALVGLVLYDYARTVSKLVITSDAITLGYPFSSREVRIADIENVVIADSQQNVVKIPEVHLHVKEQSKPIRLRDLGTDATSLYLALSAVVAERAG